MQRKGLEEENVEDEEKTKEDEEVKAKSNLSQDFEEEKQAFLEGKSKAEGSD